MYRQYYHLSSTQQQQQQQQHIVIEPSTQQQQQQQQQTTLSFIINGRHEGLHSPCVQTIPPSHIHMMTTTTTYCN